MGRGAGDMSGSRGNPYVSPSAGEARTPLKPNSNMSLDRPLDGGGHHAGPKRPGQQLRRLIGAPSARASCKAEPSGRILRGRLWEGTVLVGNWLIDYRQGVCVSNFVPISEGGINLGRIFAEGIQLSSIVGAWYVSFFIVFCGIFVGVYNDVSPIIMLPVVAVWVIGSIVFLRCGKCGFPILMGYSKESVFSFHFRLPNSNCSRCGADLP